MATFNVNGQIKSLTMRDENGIDGSADFIGNTSHGMSRDDDGNYIATEEDFQWWKNMIADYQDMQRVIREYNEKYGRDAVEKHLHDQVAWEVDLEDQPNSVRAALAEMKDEVTYKIIFEDNQGSFAVDAIATTFQGSWSNSVSNYDGHGHDLAFVTVERENAESLEEALEENDNVIEYREA